MGSDLIGLKNRAFLQRLASRALMCFTATSPKPIICQCSYFCRADDYCTVTRQGIGQSNLCLSFSICFASSDNVNVGRSRNSSAHVEVGDCV